jgi:hypothetical protein
LGRRSGPDGANSQGFGEAIVGASTGSVRSSETLARIVA